MDGIKAILLDLDGTLLEIDLHSFIPEYLENFSRWFGLISPEEFITHGLDATIFTGENRSGKLNLDVFFDRFAAKTRLGKEDCIAAFKQYYSNPYHAFSSRACPRPGARAVIQAARRRGWKVVIATNPIYVPEAVKERLAWAGIEMESCDLVTHVENSHACKPHLEYFQEIANTINVDLHECLVVGDEADDMVAANLGCTTFLVESSVTVLKPSTPRPTHAGTLEALAAMIEGRHPAPRAGPHERHATSAFEQAKARIDTITGVLVAGFMHYPLYEWLVPDERERLVKLASLQRAIARFGMHHGTTLVSPNVEGCLIGVDSRVDRGPCALLRWSMCGHGEIVETWGPATIQRWDTVSKAIETTRATHAPERHVYLMALAVKPRAQGQGHGGAILREFLARVDTDGMPCYLETFKDVNVKIYNHFGFQAVDSFTIPGTPLAIHAMVRPAARE